jgi:ParB/RepB/Spo0J family partition protein
MKLLQVGVDVPTGTIRISPRHFRKETARENLDGLIASIQEVGLIQSVSVVRHPDGTPELINGWRRFIAHQEIGLPTIRANVYEFTPEELADDTLRGKAVTQFLLAANQYEPLVPLERARFFDSLMKEFGYDVEQIAILYHRPEAEILADLRYLNLSPKVIELWQENKEKISERHLELLADHASSDKKGWRITDEEQVALARVVINKEDQLAATDPRAFQKKITQMKKEQRQRVTRERKAESERARAQQPIQVIKDVVQALARVETATAGLCAIDVPQSAEIELMDKREIIDNCYRLAGDLSGFADHKISPLSIKKGVAASVGP